MDENLIGRNKNINRGFRKLEIWKEAIALFVFIKKMIEETNDISYKVKAQVESAAFSVHSNIAEGYGRRHLKESIQFNSIALASLAENYSQVYALHQASILSRELFDQFDTIHYSLENKLINYNKSQVKQLKEKSEWQNDYVVREMIEFYGLDNSD
jgi:four helix bundle protein